MGADTRLVRRDKCSPAVLFLLLVLRERKSQQDQTKGEACALWRFRAAGRDPEVLCRPRAGHCSDQGGFSLAPSRGQTGSMRRTETVRRQQTLRFLQPSRLPQGVMTRVEESRRYPVSAKGIASTSERILSRCPARAWARARAIITVRARQTRALTRLCPRRKCRSNPKSLSRRL